MLLVVSHGTDGEGSGGLGQKPGVSPHAKALAGVARTATPKIRVAPRVTAVR